MSIPKEKTGGRVNCQVLEKNLPKFYSDSKNLKKYH